MKSVGQYVDNLQIETQENLKLLNVLDGRIRDDDSGVKLVRNEIRSLNAEQKDIGKILQEIKHRQDDFGVRWIDCFFFAVPRNDFFEITEMFRNICKFQIYGGFLIRYM